MTLVKIAKFLIPHFRLVDKDPESQSRINAKEDNVRNELAVRAADWWKSDCYTQVDRYRDFVWLGRTIFRKPHKVSITDNYFRPAHDFVDIIKEMQEKQLIFPLSEKSKVLEPGCNVGRNLYYLQNKYRCEVVGIDLSEEAVKKAEQDIWRRREKYSFQVANVLQTDFFDQFEDNYFDLVFTRWHLIHIPRSESKKAYVEKLKRIAKSFVILEPLLEGREKVEFYHNGAYALSWDNWPKEYGLSEYRSKKTTSLKDGGGTKVFYYTKPSLKS
ncbi:MAG: hypothetical protein COV74_03530 [Candidatus Omnitrophica bacterium CG11_big_fil_rev_8_21_14_0_20_45_26]|uniref:Methyltransferase domain-containing protein n=1 Tax=Candidatus Abzuiibacterium crystallinum TaxID=1974748 RepID=A0A2H0LQR3_9BACT|nr:MAG: hypothetical protein COV74_03530 [Candidatus Omnitrophica bacterium CG11_big_fil_rev_8_21_14_0_20_45_26]PIW63353.1 MAG: hypothetical protein COW12_10725 [Candidatus Omnitrophica bacterium CG12_big_fil_rev_8_21_14_0_65_45_16]